MAHWFSRRQSLSQTCQRSIRCIVECGVIGFERTSIRYFWSRDADAKMRFHRLAVLPRNIAKLERDVDLARHTPQQYRTKCRGDNGINCFAFCQACSGVLWDLEAWFTFTRDLIGI
jgi:hypothetical protein